MLRLKVYTFPAEDHNPGTVRDHWNLFIAPKTAKWTENPSKKEAGTINRCFPGNLHTKRKLQQQEPNDRRKLSLRASESLASLTDPSAGERIPIASDLPKRAGNRRGGGSTISEPPSFAPVQSLSAIEKLIFNSHKFQRGKAWHGKSRTARHDHLSAIVEDRTNGYMILP